MTHINAWIEKPGPRVRYAIDHLVGRVLGLEVRFMADLHGLRSAEGPGLAYSESPVQGALWVVPHGWLQETGTAAIDPVVRESADGPLLFPTDKGDLHFDPFAAAFFALSRHEEWGDLPADAHGRPLTRALHAVRRGYAQRPVVDEWAHMLLERWRVRHPVAPSPERRYRQVVTVDLDNGFKYRGRSWWRTLGSWSRDALRGDGFALAERLRVLLGRAHDPYQLGDDTLAWLGDGADRVLFFVLAADRGPWDHAVPVLHGGYAEYLRGLARRFEIGIHPSYRTSAQPGLTAQERSRLAHVIGRPVTLSRQHFLRFRTPRTFRELVGMGVAEEHSMGYHDLPGFRAGTCTPYPWFDLERNEPTALMVHPFTVMDNTLRDKLHLAPEKAVEAVLPLIQSVKRVRGTFTGLWHESFLAPTGPSAAWREAVRRIIHAARP